MQLGEVVLSGNSFPPREDAEMDHYSKKLDLARPPRPPATETFLTQLSPHLRSLVETIRRRVKSLDDTLEDIREHRISYGKGDIMRSFLDIQASGHRVRISVPSRVGSSGSGRSGTEPVWGWDSLLLSPEDDLEKAFRLIVRAHASV